MAENIDSLQIEISANANKAEQAIDRLADSLMKLSNSLGGISASKFSDLSNGIRQMASSMSAFSQSVKTQDFTRIANGLNKVAEINVSGVANAANAINVLTSNLSKVGTIAFDSQGIANIANAIAQLGRKTVTQATSNIPILTQALTSLVTGLNQIGAVNFDTTSLSQLVSSITKLGGKSATTAASGNIDKLAVALKNMMTTLSKAPAVSQNIIQMTQALAQLASSGSRAGIASQSLANSFNMFSSSAKNAKQHTFSLAAAFGKFYATYWLLIRGMSQFKKAIDISSDLTEVQNVVDVTFGDMSDKMNEFADSALNLYGMSELTAKQIGSRFQAMGVAMGFAQGEMSDMSIELTRLAGDMASFYNVSQDQIATALQSIFTGETEPLRRFGLDLSFATVEAWALANGLNADMQSMTQAEKTMLRYQYVLANTGAATGDFQRTINSWANQVRLLTGAFEQLGSIVGGVLINVFKPFVQALNSIMGAVINFAETVANALGAIFGWTIESSGGGITNDLATSTGEVADNLGSADTNAKKLKRTLLSFDEINMLNAPDEEDSGGGGSSGLGDFGGGAQTSIVQVDNVLDKYESEIESLYQLGEYIGQTLTDAMNSINWDSVYQSARNFGTGLANFLNGLISPELFGTTGRTIANALNTAIYAALSFGQTFDWNDLGDSIAEGINEFFRNFDFATLAETLNTWVDGIGGAISTALEQLDKDAIFSGLYTFFSNLELDTVAAIIGVLTIKKIGKFEIGKALDKAIGASISAWIVGKASGLATKIGNAFSYVFGLVGNHINFSSIGTAISTGLSYINPAMLGQMFVSLEQLTIGTWLDTNTWTGIPKAIVDTINAIIDTIGRVFSDGASKLGEVFKEFINGIFNWDSTKKTFEEAKKHFEEGGIGIVQGIIEGFVGAIGLIVEPIGDFFTSLWDAFCDVLGIHSPADSMKPIGENILLGILEGFRSQFSKFTDTVSKWANNLYSFLSQKIPEIVNSVSKWFSELPGKISTWLSNALSNVKQWGSNLAQNASSAAQNTINSVANWFQQLPGKISSLLSNALSSVMRWGENLANTGRNAAYDVINAITSTLSNLPSRMWDIGSNIVNGLWNGINGGIGWLKSAVSGFCDSVLGFFRRGFDEHSPSKKAYEIGDFFTQGLQNGIAFRFPDIYREIQNFTGNLSNMDIEAPKLNLDFAYDFEEYKPKNFNAVSEMSGTIYEEIDASMAQYAYELNRQNTLLERIEQAIYSKELRIGDKEVFDSWKRQDAREYRRTGTPTPAGIA